MMFRFSILVREVRESGTPAPLLQAWPVFVPEIARQGPKLPRLLERLAHDLRNHLGRLAQEGEGRALARLASRPELTEEKVSLRLDLKSGTLQTALLLLTYRAHGERLAFTPDFPEVVFQAGRGESLVQRAQEVYREFFREAERKEDPGPLERARNQGRLWLTDLELEVRLPLPRKRKPSRGVSLFGGEPTRGGDVELERTGRCLDRLYPDDLQRALCREREVTELTRLLTAADRRPVVLVGPPQCGKTTLVHEFVHRRAAGRERKFDRKAAVWLLSPQRLVSGMSFVGQWEERLLAILKEAKKQDHILYFEDLAGLWLAGQTSNSTTSMAHLLKPWIERGDLRLLAEMTPEMWRVQRELDRGFADLLHVLHVREPGEQDNLRILLGVQRSLERTHRCLFELDALPTVLDLQRRHAPEISFPGKAAGFLRTVAAKHARGSIGRPAVLKEFQAKTGLAAPFVETDQPLERGSIARGLARSIIGQEAAVAALADALGLARARLNDPRRPLGAFLFLGPTGVGKTQCAKAVAQFLFGEAERLLRFDMNEFVAPDAVARLSGTFAEPEGLLTSAVRRQPFCVLLLDEIEKAHPDVFDLLLQVLGEGRLTDALGRTASFANALIILTSNLGVREAGRALGFRGEGAADDTAAHFVQAAEQFFRPEFVNRLDRIVPFGRLSRAEVEGIADRVVAEVFAREGLQQRRCVLRMDAAARARIVEMGFHPELGARALKRSVERHLVQPVASRLAALPVGQRCIVSLRQAAGEFTVEVKPLQEAAPRGLPPALTTGDLAAFTRQMNAARERMLAQVDRLSPPGAVSLDSLTPAQVRYFALRECLARIGERWPQPRRDGTAFHARWRQIPLSTEPNPAELRALAGYTEQIEEGAEIASVEGALEERWAWLLRELALVEALLQGSEVERALLVRLGDVPYRYEAEPLYWAALHHPAAHLETPGVRSELLVAPDITNLWRTRHFCSVSLLEGPGVHALARAESGLLVRTESGDLMDFRTHLLAPGDDAAAIARALADNPNRQPGNSEIVRLANARQITDLRTGHRIDSPATPEALRELNLSALAWPAEIRAPQSET